MDYLVTTVRQMNFLLLIKRVILANKIPVLLSKVLHRHVNLVEMIRSFGVTAISHVSIVKIHTIKEMLPKKNVVVALTVIGMLKMPQKG